MPTRPEGETDETIKAMVRMMCDESRKLRKNQARISELMDVTFADRRAMIVTKGATLVEIRECYPCLFNEDEVCFTLQCYIPQ